MKKKVLKICYILLIILSVMTTISRAEGGTTYTEDSFITGRSSDMSEMAAKLVGKQIYLYQIIGSATAICMILALGIKYVVSSVEEKAEIKKHAVVYVVGAIFVFGAVNIVALIQDSMKGI